MREGEGGGERERERERKVIIRSIHYDYCC